MGRTAAPAALRLIGGRSPGRDSGGRVVEPTPKFKRLPPNPPTWLAAEAKAEWKRVVPELSRLDLLKPIDRSALTAYCETWALYVQATRQVRAEGLTIEAKQGLLPHPAVGIARSAGRELRAWCREFGLTPSAEGAMTVGSGDEPGDDDPFA